MAAQQTFAFLQADDSAKKAAGKRTSPDKLPIRKLPAGKLPAREPIRKPAPKLAQKTTPDTSAATTPQSVLENQSVLEKLRAQVGCVSTAPNITQPTLSTGCQVLDAMLPNNGIRVDALTEWVTSSDSSAAAVLSMIAAANHLSNDNDADNQNVTSFASSGPLVVVDTQHSFYPPAAVALGIPVERIFVVRPNSNADAVWAIDQALRCDAVGAVCAHVGSWLDDRDARRFQLAAETGKTPGLFVRPKRVRGRPSFADIRFFVQSIGSQNNHSSFAAKITIDRCRGGTVGNEMSLQINDQARIEPLSNDDSIRHIPTVQAPAAAGHETAVMHLANQLADTASKHSAASSTTKHSAASPATKHSA